VPPALGRRFADEEERPDAEPTVILGHRLWRRRFGGDPETLGRRIEVDGVPRTVVGVMPAGFRFPEATTELWLPLRVDPEQPDRSIWGHRGVGRLRPGVGPSAAQTELSALTARLPEIYPDPAQAASVFAQGRIGSLVRPLKDDVVGEVSGVLRILLGSVGLILLIACANVGNLFLVRAEARRREVALRTALGAGRGRLARLFLAEAALVAVAGGLVGLLLAEWALRLFLSLAPATLPRMEEVTIDAPVLLFACALSLLSSLVFGSMPVWRSLPAPATALHESERSTTGSPRRLRTRNLLVVAQLSLALVLMAGSGLMVRSFLQLRGVGPGCAVDGVLTLRLAPPEARYSGGPETAALYLEILERIRALPGVLAAGSGSGLPFTGDGIMIGQSFEDFPVAAGEHVRNYLASLVAPGYFEALGIPLADGRLLTRADLEQPTRAVLMSAGLARRLWPDGSALGKRLTPGRHDETGVWYEVVGVVGDVRMEGPQRPPTEMIYYPIAPWQLESRTLFFRGQSLAIRSSLPPTSLTAAVSGAIWAVDPDLPIADVRSMETVVSEATARTSFTMLLLLVAAGVALALGGIGLYGVIAFVVSQRTGEIGIRMALGADRGRLMLLVLRQGLALAAVGVAIGLGGAVAVTRLLRAFLFEVSPTDPLTLVAVSALLVSIAALACLVPARRAARLDPVSALRHE
jgi:predicted permease